MYPHMDKLVSNLSHYHTTGIKTKMAFCYILPFPDIILLRYTINVMLF